MGVRRGVCGVVPFQRGNADSRSKLDLTDAIFILDFLFAGGGAPPCRDAADVDDDGLINVTAASEVLKIDWRTVRTRVDPVREPDVE